MTFRTLTFSHFARNHVEGSDAHYIKWFLNPRTSTRKQKRRIGLHFYQDSEKD